MSLKFPVGLLVACSLFSVPALAAQGGPLVGPTFPINIESFADGGADVAYDDSTDRYLVVWRRALTASDRRVRGQLLDGQGVPIGSTIFFDSLQDATGDPVVVNVNESDRFLVAWTTPAIFNEQIVAQACDAASGTLSGAVPVLLGFTGDGIAGYDLGGEGRVSPEATEALVVARRGSPTPGIYAVSVEVPTSGDPVPAEPFPIAVDIELLTTNADPSVASSGGLFGQWLVAFRTFNLLDGDWEVRAVVVDREDQLATNTLTLTSNDVDELPPRVDGGANYDTEFAVVYEREAPDLLRELELTTLTVEGGQLVATGSSVVTQSLTALGDYDVAWTQGRATLVWAVRALFQSTWFVYTRDFDATDADPCGDQATVTSVDPASGGVELAIASVQSGGQFSLGDGLITFGYDAGGTSGDVMGQRFDALVGGQVDVLGGSCGAGGTVVPFGDAVLGNGFFRLTLVGADPTSSVTILNLSTPVAPIQCGGCEWLPFQTTVTQPTLNGASQAFLSIPCEAALAGQTFQAQFTTLTPAASPCALANQVSVSDRVSVTLGS